MRRVASACGGLLLISSILSGLALRSATAQTVAWIPPTSYRDEIVQVMRPVWVYQEEEQQVTVRRPVYETSERQETYTVQRPVIETVERVERHMVLKPVYETAVRDESYIVYDPVVSYQMVYSGLGTWTTLPVTSHFPRVVTRRVPVQTLRYVQEEQLRKVPIQTVRYVEEQHVRKVPVQTVRYVEEQQVRKVQVLVQKMVQEQVVRRVPVTTYQPLTTHYMPGEVWFPAVPAVVPSP